MKYKEGDKFIIEINKVLGYSQNTFNGIYDIKDCLGIALLTYQLDRLEKYEPVNVTEISRQAYDAGMNEAWEIAKKIGCYPFTPQEAKEKIEAWEKEQSEIHVGDVVTLYDGTGEVFLVLQITEKDFCSLLPLSDGKEPINTTIEECVKRGKITDLLQR